MNTTVKRRDSRGMKKALPALTKSSGNSSGYSRNFYRKNKQKQQKFRYFFRLLPELLPEKQPELPENTRANTNDTFRNRKNTRANTNDTFRKRKSILKQQIRRCRTFRHRLRKIAFKALFISFPGASGGWVIMRILCRC